MQMKLSKIRLNNSSIMLTVYKDKSQVNSAEQRFDLALHRKQERNIKGD